MPGPRLSVVDVTHDSREASARTLPALANELTDQDGAPLAIVHRDVELG